MVELIAIRKLDASLRVSCTVPCALLSATWFTMQGRRLNRSSLAVLRILGQHLPGTEEDAAKEDIALKRAAEKGDRHPVAFHQAGEASVVHAAHHRIEPAAEVADQEKAYGAEQS